MFGKKKNLETWETEHTETDMMEGSPREEWKAEEEETGKKKWFSFLKKGDPGDKPEKPPLTQA